MRVVVDEPAFDARGRTFCYAYDDRSTSSAARRARPGAVLNKLQELFTSDVPVHDRFAHAVDLAEESVPGANGLTVMPFLSGERAPYWIAELRGGIAGLDLSHTRGDVMRAAFESVVFALATVFDVLRERIAPHPTASGSPAASPSRHSCDSWWPTCSDAKRCFPIKTRRPHSALR